jgi:hypothetical protein
MAREVTLATFKKLTAAEDRTVWVNIDDISLAEPFNEGTQTLVRVTFNNGQQIVLSDDVRAIVGSEEKPNRPDNFDKLISYPKSSPA